MHNRYEALETEKQEHENCGEDPSRGLSRVSQSTPRLKTASAKNKRRVIVIGDFLPRGTEGLTSQPNPTHRKVCCLPGRGHYLEALCSSTAFNYYSLLIAQTGSDEAMGRSLSTTKRDLSTLELVNGVRGQVVFPPSLQEKMLRVTGKPTCSTHGLEAGAIGEFLLLLFIFLNHGVVYSAPDLLAAHGVYLSLSKGEDDSSPGGIRAH